MCAFFISVFTFNLVLRIMLLFMYVFIFFNTKNYLWLSLISCAFLLLVTRKLRTELPSFLPGCKSHETHHWCKAVNGMMVRRQNPVLKQLKSLQWYLEWRLCLCTRQNRLLYDRVIYCLTRKTDCFIGKQVHHQQTAPFSINIQLSYMFRPLSISIFSVCQYWRTYLQRIVKAVNNNGKIPIRY
jgi:hypothetical protein